MADWMRIKKSVTEEGTTITYASSEVNAHIESRKRHIPHANGAGTWDHTSYFVVKRGKGLKECQSLSDAKEFAEALP